MAARGSALCDQQVPPVAASVQVRGLRCGESGSAPEPPRLGQQDAGRRIDHGLQDDRGVAERGPGQMAHAAGVPGEIGIHPERARDEDRFAPRPGRILGRHDQLPLAHPSLIGRDQPEAAVVMTQGRGEDPAAVDRLALVQLAHAIEDVADLRPPDQVAAVEDRHGREVLEGGDGDVIILAHAADRRVRVEARENRVAAHAAPLPLVAAVLRHYRFTTVPVTGR